MSSIVLHWIRFKDCGLGGIVLPSVDTSDRNEYVFALWTEHSAVLICSHYSIDIFPQEIDRTLISNLDRCHIIYDLDKDVMRLMPFYISDSHCHLVGTRDVNQLIENYLKRNEL